MAIEFKNLVMEGRVLIGIYGLVAIGEKGS